MTKLATPKPRMFYFQNASSVTTIDLVAVKGQNPAHVSSRFTANVGCFSAAWSLDYGDNERSLRPRHRNHGRGRRGQTRSRPREYPLMIRKQNGSGGWMRT